MRRVKLKYLLQRWREALFRTWRRQVPALTPQPAEWIEGIYLHKEPVPRRFFGRRAALKLRYRLYLPRDRHARGKFPLLVMLHGCSQDATEFAAGTRMNAIAQEHGCAVLYPEQSSSANAMRCWNWFSREAQQGQGEADLLVHLVQDCLNRESVDERRVYIAGMSAGAGMAEILALRNPRLFAASALHSGVMYGAAGSAGEALRVMRAGTSVSPVETARRIAQALGLTDMLAPVLVLHGSLDATVNPRNAEQIVALRLALAGLPGGVDGLGVPAEETELEMGGRKVRQRDYAREATLLVRSLLIEGLGHAWSGGDAQLKFNDSNGPDASRMVMDFLLRHRRGQG